MYVSFPALAFVRRTTRATSSLRRQHRAHGCKDAMHTVVMLDNHLLLAGALVDKLLDMAVVANEGVEVSGICGEERVEEHDVAPVFVGGVVCLAGARESCAREPMLCTCFLPVLVPARSDSFWSGSRRFWFQCAPVTQFRSAPFMKGGGKARARSLGVVW